MKKLSLDRIYLSVGPSSVDACLLQKGDGVQYYAEDRGIDLRKTGYIGDSSSDISVMKIPEIGLIGAPANVEPEVVRFMEGSGKRHFVSDKNHLDGFFDFYERAREMGLDAVISDRDGVLTLKTDLSRGREFARRLKEAGQKENPAIVMLTGSALEQNTGFLETYGFNPENLRGNTYVARNPYLALLENSALWINVLKPQESEIAPVFEKEVLKTFMERFKGNVLVEMEDNVLPDFGFGWTGDQSDKNAKVYAAPKSTMVTFDLPRTTADGADFRKSPDAEAFRKAVLDVMKQEAEKLHLSVTMT